jgi:hypothetical protein
LLIRFLYSKRLATNKKIKKSTIANRSVSSGPEIKKKGKRKKKNLTKIGKIRL